MPSHRPPLQGISRREVEEAIRAAAQRDILDTESQGQRLSRRQADGDRPEAITALALLTTIERAHALLDDLAQRVARRAVRAGADFPDLGRAIGVTRQATRSRWPDLATPIRLYPWLIAHRSELLRLARRSLDLPLASWGVDDLPDHAAALVRAAVAGPHSLIARGYRNATTRNREWRGRDLFDIQDGLASLTRLAHRDQATAALLLDDADGLLETMPSALPL
ncbi:hypothetical protein [Cryptosporangium phraense]|uniref:Uncharacterized protein n=1 Tax=Cryptosporangium phraense TaxID=2593070 RepID=A0A545AND9_9ACTN|nr:hypothetical protein [Cryptosporangium phraense]TQS42854.1 hypothetical protein FL583_22655 [Cryptosporangium phraense]